MNVAYFFWNSTQTRGVWYRRRRKENQFLFNTLPMLFIIFRCVNRAVIYIIRNYLTRKLATDMNPYCERKRLILRLGHGVMKQFSTRMSFRKSRKMEKLTWILPHKSQHLTRAFSMSSIRLGFLAVNQMENNFEEFWLLKLNTHLINVNRLHSWPMFYNEASVISP